MRGRRRRFDYADELQDADITVSVKCRTGVEYLKESSNCQGDEIVTYDQLASFIDVVAREGKVNNFVIHARKAILGLRTIENRMVSRGSIRFFQRG
eukprot:746682-Hanusia_phi.AAC.1